MNIYTYIALALSCFLGFVFALLLIASVTEEPILNQMQTNYYQLWQDEIQVKEYYKQNYLACIIENTDPQTKVTLRE